VDRLLALFQALQPESWLEPADSGSGGLWAPTHATIDANWGLQPFWKDEQSFYTSYDVRNTAVFGYAYPETQSWDYASEDDWRRAVTAYIAQTYPTRARTMLTENGAQSAGGLAHLLTNSTFTDWSIVITASTEELPGTFRVEFVFTDSTSTDADAPVVGQWMQLMPMGTNKHWKTSREGRKIKRFSALEVTRNGTVSLTTGLLDQVMAGQLAGLNAEAVVPYLMEHLAWRVTGVSAHPSAHEKYSDSVQENGAALGDDDLDAFTLDIVSTNVRIPDDASQLLEYDDTVTLHPGVMGSRGRLSCKPYC
jgi:tyrosinase